MRGESSGLIIGISIGLVIGVLLAIFALFCIRYHRRRSQIGNSSSRRAATIPIRANGADSCTILSDSTIGPESPVKSGRNRMPMWLEGFRRSNVVSASGIPEYPYKDLQKATYNFTTLIGQGAFGPVYKAQMSTGETVAVKVLATDSKQGEKEFQTEVMLLGRLHHRNLVNLVGYCAEKGQHILVYVYMSKGSLASHLYSENHEPLSWNLRVYIALDVARGLEYLHDGVIFLIWTIHGHVYVWRHVSADSCACILCLWSKFVNLFTFLFQAVPPVIHRDIKSSNILLDESMRARVADFGLSREEMVDKHKANIRGTFGYLDPEYISTRTFTKKTDVYSFGVLLFELIAGRNPLQGLMEYVELAAISTEGKVGWEEIVDSRLDGKFDVQELNEIAALAYKCVNRVPKKRPSMRDIVQVLTRILKTRHSKKHQKSPSATVDEVTADLEQGETRILVTEHQRDESMDSTADTFEM
ncbi:calcium/calmodulin-regulated receptor-like kinase 1 isoform X1 [Durio zibethinus]|uniref:Calcium/calmodulin-regulated receptor-like kinase 1 isoform X1 n=1 Tax=Durio zibethinus TaxID=66656 RepID=A0A6P5Y4M7_DURZI|nr:calcium/calmodulin-regulated receptor-like kinase 1 isoform X1 [Durio zibethinus]XP_022734965.1 calcium/calmodulin-regulated receptor-like kinase 1 isoform X1 [Durio zibethinus]XP_022734966.1 calcium/calmodulin-regulated receptor-like kinase 1 isoform X1 [Durio zibethinus]